MLDELSTRLAEGNRAQKSQFKLEENIRMLYIFPVLKARAGAHYCFWLPGRKAQSCWLSSCWVLLPGDQRTLIIQIQGPLHQRLQTQANLSGAA